MFFQLPISVIFPKPLRGGHACAGLLTRPPLLCNGFGTKPLFEMKKWSTEILGTLNVKVLKWYFYTLKSELSIYAKKWPFSWGPNLEKCIQIPRHPNRRAIPYYRYHTRSDSICNPLGNFAAFQMFYTKMGTAFGKPRIVWSTCTDILFLETR